MIISWEAFANRHPLVEAKEWGGSYTNGKDLQALCSLALSHAPAKILEIGTGFGETAARLADTCLGATVHTFDVCKEAGGYDTGSMFTAREVRPQAEVGRAARGHPRVRMTVAPGTDLPQLIRESVPPPYDFVFIDGDHTWRRVAEDTKVALAVAGDNAIVVWDDYWYFCPEVGRYVDLVNERVGNLICHVIDTRLCFTPLTPIIRRHLIAQVADL